MNNDLGVRMKEDWGMIHDCIDAIETLMKISPDPIDQEIAIRALLGRIRYELEKQNEKDINTVKKRYKI